MRMDKRLWIGVLTGLLTLSAAAQTAQDAENALRENLVKKQFFLRGFSEDKEIRWNWNGKALIQAEPRFLTIGVVTIKSVKLNGEHVMILGDRRTLVQESDTKVQFSSEATPVVIDVDLHDANLTEVLPTLPRWLFYTDMKEALSQIPSGYRELLPTRVGERKKPAESNCDCEHPELCQERVSLLEMQGMKRPVVKTSVAPEVPLPRQGSGTMTAVFALDATGQVRHVWLGRPLTPEIDEGVLRAFKQYTFSPATCHDKPVVSALPMDWGFSSASATGDGRSSRR
jgi:hypothetical protein